MLNEAATAAEITGYEWDFWSTDTGYMLYYPIDAFAYFDDPQQLWRSFEGTYGQAGRDEFFSTIQAIPSRSRTEIVESIPSLEYWPEGFSEVNAAHFHFEWLADGFVPSMSYMPGDMKSTPAARAKGGRRSAGRMQKGAASAAAPSCFERPSHCQAVRSDRDQSPASAVA
jgi:hypothetical protein